jgi:hypothetical protein
MKPIYFVIFTALILTGCGSKKFFLAERSKAVEPAAEEEEAEEEETTPSSAASSNDPWSVQSVKGSVITFKNQKTINTKLSFVNVVSLVYSQDGTRYILLSGKECKVGDSTCDAYTNLYLHRLQDDPGKAKSFVGGAPMPGRLIDTANKRKTVQHYRVYYGDCVAGKPPMVVWIGWALEEQKRVKVVAAYILDGKKPKFDALPEPLPKMGHIESQARKGNCFEVKPVDQKIQN